MALSAAPRPSAGAPEFSLSRPNVARMCNYLLNGKDNFEADRLAADDVLRRAPEMLTLVRANRDFLTRAIRRLTEGPGIGQFLDLGTGMPMSPSVHEIAARFHPSPRVAYVDNDSVAVAHARALLDNGDTVVAVDGDLREPERILADPRLTSVIDFERPVAVLLSAVLHFVTDEEGAARIVGALRDALAPGSALVISHACLDHADPQVLADVAEVYTRTGLPLVPRSRARIGEFFTGFELIDPGLTDVAHWPLTTGPRPRPALTFYGGVAGYPARHRMG
ncbi:S-adenosyl methyltransferase [Thermomonospora echinospora]|uniref:S-adenosyl methyltransferase n=1 Tax=Thermomonospora echinospora TaxID=1992 RepID=A0A1H6B870_9ACTN|nr:SAM-dependent methyltransferase [Thermomonospora echinospora]SEG56407.1 S-adenosyl methyltransferase [Thermomonospora echinospora]